MSDDTNEWYQNLIDAITTLNTIFKRLSKEWDGSKTVYSETIFDLSCKLSVIDNCIKDYDLLSLDTSYKKTRYDVIMKNLGDLLIELKSFKIKHHSNCNCNFQMMDDLFHIAMNKIKEL